MKGCKAMVETKYEANPLKTFLCFVIYKVVITIISNIIGFFLAAMYNEVLTDADRVHDIFFSSLMLFTLLINIVLSFITVPLLRKLLIQEAPSLMVSSANAVLYIGLSYLLGMFFFPRKIHHSIAVFVSLAYATNFIMFVFFLALYFHYKNKLNSYEATDSDNNYDMDKEQNHDDCTE